MVVGLRVSQTIAELTEQAAAVAEVRGQRSEENGHAALGGTGSQITARRALAPMGVST